MFPFLEVETYHLYSIVLIEPLAAFQFSKLSILEIFTQLCWVQNM